MATWTNGTKNSSTFANDSFGSTGRTWDEAIEIWNENAGIWLNPYAPYANQAKSASSFTNETKN